MLRRAGETKQLNIITGEGLEARVRGYIRRRLQRRAAAASVGATTWAHGLSPSLARDRGEEPGGRCGPHRGCFFSGTDTGPLHFGCLSGDAHPQGLALQPGTLARGISAPGARSGPRRCSQAAGQPGSGGGSRASYGEAGGLQSQSRAARRAEATFAPRHTCRPVAMSRVVSLLLGAALLCGHGAFCRRVVSGESRAARRALKPGEGIAGRAGEGLRVQGWRLSQGLETREGQVGGRRRQEEIDCMLLSPHPSLNTQESLHSFGSAWFSSCEASSASSWAVQHFLGLISTFFVRELAAGLVPVEGVGYRGGRQSPETEEQLQKCHPLLAWLDSSPRPPALGSCS